jgi:hypothetical protein
MFSSYRALPRELSLAQDQLNFQSDYIGHSHSHSTHFFSNWSWVNPKKKVNVERSRASNFTANPAKIYRAVTPPSTSGCPLNHKVVGGYHSGEGNYQGHWRWVDMWRHVDGGGKQQLCQVGSTVWWDFSKFFFFRQTLAQFCFHSLYKGCSTCIFTFHYLSQAK